MKSKLEYIWLDGYNPTQSLRSKTMVREDFGGDRSISVPGILDSIEASQAA